MGFLLDLWAGQGMVLTACSGGTWGKVPKEPTVIVRSISQKSSLCCILLLVAPTGSVQVEGEGIDPTSQWRSANITLPEEHGKWDYRCFHL